jgi:hypothetical protein
MKRVVAITDLTRMQGGYVCVAGQAEGGEWVRLSAPRPHELELVVDGQAVLFPGAVVECDLQQHQPQPPHTEDYRYDPGSVRRLGRLAPEAWRSVLEQACFGSVREIFEQTIHDDHGRYILDGSGPRSLGTIQPAAIHQVHYAADATKKWDYRLGFYDAADAYYRLKITDLTWHRYCDSLRGPDSQPPAIAARLTQQLKAQRRAGGVFLRIGLSRGWREHPDRCYLQINGIYTFPDYLDGRTVADFGLQHREPG